jgi:hypothetical protein
LDDSGKDPQNRITTIAGYAATEDQWRAFEAEVEPIFASYGVNILHATDLHGTRGEFSGWTGLKKESFVARLYSVMSRHVLLGVSASALKATYETRAAESARKRTVKPYTFCANMILDWLLLDIKIGRIANTEGTTLIIESGHEHNAEAEQHFSNLRKLHKLEDILRPIRFVTKDDCRAVQMADLFAFYSRRHGVAMEAAPPYERERMQRTPGQMLNIMTERLRHRAFVANEFGPTGTGSRFFAGDQGPHRIVN